MFENFTKEEKKILSLIILFTALGLTVMGLQGDGEGPVGSGARGRVIADSLEAKRMKQLFRERLRTKRERQARLPDGFKVKLNSASREELKLLPGIGKVTAARILEYREVHNDFQTISELKNVKGIGTKTFAKIEKYLILTSNDDKK